MAKCDLKSVDGNAVLLYDAAGVRIWIFAKRLVRLCDFTDSCEK